MPTIKQKQHCLEKVANYFWDYEYVPEIAHTAIPREEQAAAYDSWAKHQSKENMNQIMRTFSKLINSEVGRYQGTLQRPTLKSYAKKYVADAVRSYDPKTKNMLSTHIVNNLQRLHRLNYRNVQGLRSNEDIQRKMKDYFLGKEELTEELGREPDEIELSKKLNITPKALTDMENKIKLEVSSTQEQNPSLFYEDPKEEIILDYVYNDLPDHHKKILEYRLGYNNTPILNSNEEIGKKLGLSPVRVTQISKNISDKIKNALTVLK